MHAARPVETRPEATLEDRVAAAIDTVGGDPVEALRALLKAVDELEADITFAELSLSRGFMRGRRLRLISSNPRAS